MTGLTHGATLIAVTTPEYTPQPAAGAPPATDTRLPKKQRTWLAPAIVGMVVGFLLGAGATTAAYTLSTSSSGGSSEQQQILSTCHEAVKDKLKAPATAQFSKEEITNESTAVSGKVDSQNGFGALIRGSFTCTMSKSSGQWEATNVTLSSD